MVRPLSSMGPFIQIIINPAQNSFTILSEKTICSQGVCLGKAQGQPAYKCSPKKLLCYYCEGEHLIKDSFKLAKERSQDKQKDTEVDQQYKNKLRDAVQRESITVNEALFAGAPETTYSVEQMEQLIGNLQLYKSN